MTVLDHKSLLIGISLESLHLDSWVGSEGEDLASNATAFTYLGNAGVARKQVHRFVR